MEINLTNVHFTSEQRASKNVESRMKRTSVPALKNVASLILLAIALRWGFPPLAVEQWSRRVQNATQRQFTTHFDFFPFLL